MKRLPLLDLVDKIERAAWLDSTSSVMGKIVGQVIRPQWLRDILHGVPIGHPLHPMAVQVPLGAWTSAALLDAVPGAEKSADVLVGAGVVAALPAAVAGYTDWSELQVPQQRVGVVHSVSNLVAVTLYTASLVQRMRGRRSSAKLLGYAGFAVVAGSGFLGGHLAYRQAAGANHTESVPHRFPAGWHALAPLAEIPEGELTQHVIAEQPLLVYRQRDNVNVLSDVCSHLAGPLHEGRLVNNDACVECPWHKSVFSLATGEVVHGPATSPQPHFQTRLSDGVVEVCLVGADG